MFLESFSWSVSCFAVRFGFFFCTISFLTSITVAMALENVELQRGLQSRRSTVNFFANRCSRQQDIPIFSGKKIKNLGDLWRLWTVLASQQSCQKQKIHRASTLTLGGKCFIYPKCVPLNIHTGALQRPSKTGNSNKLCDDYSLRKNKLFFDRDPTFLLHIFHFYKSELYGKCAPSTSKKRSSTGA